MKRLKAGGVMPDELPKGESIEPKCIYEVLGAIKSECLKGRQEDAEEFLSSVLNGLHEEMIKLQQSTHPFNGEPQANGHIDGNGVDNKFGAAGDEADDDDDDANLWKEVGPRHKALPTRTVIVSEITLNEVISKFALFKVISKSLTSA